MVVHLTENKPQRSRRAERGTTMIEYAFVVALLALVAVAAVARMGSGNARSICRTGFQVYAAGGGSVSSMQGSDGTCPADDDTCVDPCSAL